MEIDDQILVVFEDIERRLERVPRMHDQRQSRLTSELAMLDEELFLRLQRFGSVGIMDIESGLAYSDDMLFVVRI